MDTEPIARTVLVGVDGSPSALRAVRWGAAEAARRRMPLQLLTTFAWAVDPGGEPGDTQDRYREVLLGRSRAGLDEAVQAAAEEAPDIEIRHRVVIGSAIAVLVEESRRADVVVLGSRGLTRLDGLVIGSVAAALATRAACPVVVVRGAEWESPEADPRPVVVGVDGSATSEAAVGFAFEAAAARGVTLVAVHAWSDLIPDPAVEPSLDWTSIESDQHHLLGSLLAPWAEKHPDVAVEQVLTRAGPGRTLVEQSERAQLLVVGSRGRAKFAGLVLGSVSNAVLHRADCPVAIARHMNR